MNCACNNKRKSSAASDVYKRQLDESFEKFSKKMNDLERMMWVYGGGFALAAFVLANWGDVAKLLLKN